MAEGLWGWQELVEASGGIADGTPARAITGVSIDTRTLEPGDLFVALRGDNQDGHAYVSRAFEKGAAAALVSHDYVKPADCGPLVRVDDTLDGLRGMGRAARARLSPEARVIAVTGSVGKTSTKEMLRLCLTAVDARTHASAKSYNNHWGVPLTLARMPRDTRFAVLEIGMNHAGEIRPLTRLARPHVAIVTTVGPVHLEFFSSVEEIARAKAEIFDGLEPGGVALLPFWSRYCPILEQEARVSGASILHFGPKSQRSAERPDYSYGDIHILDTEMGSKGPCEFELFTPGQAGSLQVVLGAVGLHQVRNATAALAASCSVGAGLNFSAAALKEFKAGEGRGARTEYVMTASSSTSLIDESYNANPLSMEAAIGSMTIIYSRRRVATRRIAVLGDMRELGPASDRLHEELWQPVRDARIDLALLCGEHMQALRDKLRAETAIPVIWQPKSTDLIAPLLAEVRAGDVVMVKGSLGTRMAPIVEALKEELARRAAEAAR